MPEQRTEGTKIDLERLEKHARSLYLHRFVEAIQQARGEHGRYLTLRAGDELAIRAAADGSDEWLERILVLDEGPSTERTG
ncbi:hypothetical protein BH20ACT21_BH20ACT21_11110 [soil metagenome]|nr:hypothetical protein [Actinomycetota bacterium]